MEHRADLSVCEEWGDNMLDSLGAGAYVKALARALFLCPRDQWAMLAAYFDESGTHDDSKIMVLGGLISPVFQWERLANSWSQALSHHGLTDFHTVDCAHGVNAFASWNRERRSKLYEQLVALTKRHVLWRTWTAIFFPEYVQFFPDRHTAYRMAYAVCATGCASRILQLAKQRDTLIPYVFEQGGRGGKYALSVFQMLIESGDKDFYRMGSLAVDSRRKLIPLQVADIHAYEVYKYFSDQLDRPATIRRSFREILKIPQAGKGGYLFDGEKFQDWIRRMRAGERPIQIPVDRLDTEQQVVLKLL